MAAHRDASSSVTHVPRNPEAERALLGAILIRPDVLPDVAALLNEHDFSEEAHRLIFRSMMSIEAQRLPIDYVALKQELERQGDLGRIGGPVAIVALVDGVPGRENADYYARIVKEKSTLRQLIAQANLILEEAYAAERDALPEFLMQAVLTFDDTVSDEGQLVKAVALPWFEIIQVIARDPSSVDQIGWRRWEEIVAGAYAALGFDVVLTPRSGDRGRDVIATKRGIGSVRFFDQVKAYSPGRVVTAHDVRAMVGVLHLDSNVSKGIITTTSVFAPGVYDDPDIRRFTPYRLELKPRDTLLSWLISIAKERHHTG